MIFVTGPMKEHVEDFVKSNYSFKASFIEQKKIDGVAGSIKLVEPLVNKEDVLIVFSDTIFEADLGLIKKAQKDSGTDGVIWVKEVKDPQRFGVVVVVDNGIITKMVEKPDQPISKLANIGVYYVKNSSMMFEGIDHIYQKKITKNGEYFLTDAFVYMIEAGARLRTATAKGWYDCGTFETLLETNRILLQKNHVQKSKAKNSLIIAPVFIDEGVIIENSIVGPFVSVAKGCEIKGSIVDNSILGPSATLNYVAISCSTIGENAFVHGVLKKLNIGDSSRVSYN